MSTRVLSATSPSVGKRRRSEGVRHEAAVNDSFQSSSDTLDGRDGIYNFLHNDLRISSDVATFYSTSLTENGYDDLSSLQDATENDLKELGVKIGHVRRIKRAVFSNCMKNERRSSGRTRRVSELHLVSNEISDERFFDRESLDVSLLSDYARQEIRSNTPLSREHSVDLSIADAKELLIRKQADKIASLEAKLANVDFNGSMHDDGEELRSAASRGGSADIYSKKLTPEERLQAHKERKLQENKYKEKVGKWDQPQPAKKVKSLTRKVSENDDLVLKLTSDPSIRRKIDEKESSAKRASRKMLQGDDFRGRSSGTMHSSPPKSMDKSRLSISNKMNIEEGKQMEYGRNNSNFDSGSKHANSANTRRSSRGRDSDNSFSSHDRGSKQVSKKRSTSICCDTCGSSRNCEEDVDNPGIFYCKCCWDEYEGELVTLDNPSPKREQVVSISDPVVTNEPAVHHALWIVHDNPQLGDKIAYSGPNRMECMIETKEPGKKDCVRIIIGDIDFSGNVKSSGIGNAEGSENDQGAECIRIRNAKGYYIDHNQVASRLSRDKSLYEFHLGDENAHLLTGKNASKSVGEFFKDCTGAIDVILSPQRDNGGWYPQKEARSGGRKIAPQFRSKGVGYIRLGDDMSANGLAFLSSNACSTFLLSVSNNKTASQPKKTSPSATKMNLKQLKSNSSEREDNENSLPNAANAKIKSVRQSKKPLPPPSDDSDDSDDDSEDEVQNVSEVLKQLQSPDMASSMKWKDKAELLSQLGKGASRHDGRHARSQALNIIQDTLGGKNANIHVVRSALIAVGMIGVSMGGELVTQASWKTIMIETIKLLKSKQCQSVAKTVLTQLHGRCFTLSNSLELISHVLGLGLTASASTGKKSRMSRAMESPKPRKTSPSGGDSVEVIEWLAESTGRERNMEVINPMLEKNSSLNMLVNIFLCHADHRDQRCRKNVLDGLMHCVLYGVQKLEMELTRAMRMCSTIKESNPKGWNNICQGAQMILEDEQR